MTKTRLMITVCASLLWAGVALATPTPQQSCDYARIRAWRAFSSCIEGLVARDAKGVSFGQFAAFAKCRHAYFKEWTGFQAKLSLAPSTCIGARFLDGGDQTVTDNLSGLVWEKKGSRDGVVNYADPHDADNFYTWTMDTGAGLLYRENGTAFTGFLAALNAGGGSAGSNGWRLPTITELQTIILNFPCTGSGANTRCACPEHPCVDPALDSSNTAPGFYWSATGYLPDPYYAWFSDFFDGDAEWGRGASTQATAFVRAVRGGL